MERLISMTDFVLQEVKPENLEKCEFENAFTKIYRYAEFIKQKLELWMFVPCKLVDGVWIPIKGKENHFIRKELDEYIEADKIVLFEGFELNQKDLSKLENIICITKNKIQVTFFKRENSVFLDNLTTNKTYEAKKNRRFSKIQFRTNPNGEKTNRIMKKLNHLAITAFAFLLIGTYIWIRAIMFLFTWFKK